MQTTRPATAQPTAPKPHSQSGLADGLIASIEANWAIVGKAAAPTSTGSTLPSMHGTVYGLGNKTNGGTFDRRLFFDGPRNTTDPWTFAVALVPYANESLSHLFGFGILFAGSTIDTATAPGEYRSLLNFNSNYHFWASSSDWNTGIPFDTDGRLHVAMVVSDGANLYFYRDGALRATSAIPGGFLATQAGRYMVLGNRHSSGANSPNATLLNGRVWNRALNAGEAFRYAQNPWAVYEEELTVLPSGSTVQNLAGDAAAAAAAAAQLAITKAMAGAATGSGAATAELLLLKSLLGAASAQAAAVGDLALSKLLAGAASAQGAATGDLSVGAGTITTPALKNNTGTVLSGETGATVHVYTTAGAFVVTKTGETTDGSGVMAFSDAAIAPGTEYRCVIVLASGAEGMEKLTAT